MAGDEVYFLDLKKDYIDTFDLAKYLEYANGLYLIINSYFIHKLRTLPVVGYYQVQAEIMRADTISYDLFNGLEEFWSLILLYNGITKFQDLKANTKLKIFNLADIEELDFSMALKQQLKEKEVIELNNNSILNDSEVFLLIEDLGFIVTEDGDFVVI